VSVAAIVYELINTAIDDRVFAKDCKRALRGSVRRWCCDRRNCFSNCIGVVSHIEVCKLTTIYIAPMIHHRRSTMNAERVSVD